MMMETQSPHLVGVIGHPLGHSLSPAMHTAAFQQLRLPYTYGVFDVSEEYLPALVAALRRPGIAGANVTVPYKERVIPYLDSVDEDASALGAVNTIVSRDGRLKGFNTDIAGIRKSLEPVAEKIRGTSVLILGAGGVARAALHAVGKAFAPERIKIFNRTPGRGRALAAEFAAMAPAIRCESIADSASLRSAVSGSTLIINATSVGMAPEAAASPLPAEIRFSNQQIIMDIVYNPVETALLRHARHDGAQTINGVEMFVQQGAASFALWTGKAFPADLARATVMRALT